MIPARWRIPLFALLCAAQLALAVSIIVGAERVLEQGELWRFRTEPVDPVDIVRGRYVALRFEATSGPIAPGATLPEDGVGFAVLEADEEGFARVKQVWASRPTGGAYLYVNLTSVSETTADFEFPVDRFYMPEEQAPIAERLDREARSEGRGTWAEIRVHEGDAILEQLYIDGVPAGEAAQQAPTEPPQP